MEYICAGYSDRGNVKETNEDSFSLSIAETDHGQAGHGFGVTASVVLTKASWPAEPPSSILTIGLKKLPELLRSFSWSEIEKEWEESVKIVNQSILDYSKEKIFRLGPPRSWHYFTTKSC